MTDGMVWKGADVMALLTLEELDRNLYRNRLNQTNPNNALFGGQVLAQGLMAATLSVDTARHAHSLHGYFLRAGDSSRPVVYQVERTRDGGRFSTRRVTALQHGQAILHLECSFHVPEEGFDHHMSAPPAPHPLMVREIGEMLEEPGSAQMVAWLRNHQAEGATAPIEMRPVPSAFGGKFSGGVRRQVWMRITEKVPTDFASNACLLTYLSDYYLSGTAALPYSETNPNEMFMASLDHALWFHRPVKADSWLLFDFDSPSASSGRGFARGEIFNESGVLVASLAQEALMRRKRAEPGEKQAEPGEK